MWPRHTLLVQGVLWTDLLAYETPQLGCEELPLTMWRDTTKHLLIVLNADGHQQPVLRSLAGRLAGRLA
jgi:hypothetical protein